MKRLSNPYLDRTRKPLSADEARVLLRLLAGDTLVCDTLVTAGQYRVYWYWEMDARVDEQMDWSVILLLARQAIRPVLVGGGFTKMILTPAGRAKAKAIKKRSGK